MRMSILWLSLLCALKLSLALHLQIEYDPKSLENRFEGWLSRHTRQYKNRDEWMFRYGVYRSNIESINFLNAQNMSFTVTDNQFADMTNDEFKLSFLGRKPSVRQRQSGNSTKCDKPKGAVPKAIDWRKKGAATPAKDQGRCGSCWAFSVVAAVEGINQIETGKLVSLSEQELLDCDKFGLNLGCQGGLAERAFQFIKTTGGLASEEDYPYNGKSGLCNIAKAAHKVARIAGYRNVPANDERCLLQVVAQQPVSVGIDAFGVGFQLYDKGVYSGLCGNKLNPDVVRIRYGEENGQKCWLVKNSRGTKWGAGGYIKMKRGSSDKEGACGINKDATYPLKSFVANFAAETKSLHSRNPQQPAHSS